MRFCREKLVGYRECCKKEKECYINNNILIMKKNVIYKTFFSCERQIQYMLYLYTSDTELVLTNLEALCQLTEKKY